jgi:hypothetical protein
LPGGNNLVRSCNTDAVRPVVKAWGQFDCRKVLQANVLTKASAVLWGESTVRRIIINRLFQSFSELEQSIVSARATLGGKRNAPPELLNRITMYEEILIKQRELATVLCGHAAIGNWSEVARHIKLINGLSHMIRDDAREILDAAQPQTEYDHHGVTYC